MVDRYSYNGNDPERHREFLRALRAVVGSFHFLRSTTSSHRAPACIGLEIFLQNLAPDATTIIDFDDPETIRIDTSYANDPRDPTTSWRLEYDTPWTERTHERIDALRCEHYGK